MSEKHPKMLESKLNRLTPEQVREFFAEQDPHIMKFAAEIAELVQGLAPDPLYPELKPRALLVGGFVRDSIMRKKSKDADLEVYGVTPERLLELLINKFGPDKIDTVGKQFEVIKVFIDKDISLDISIPRRDSKKGSGHKGFEITGDPTMSIEEAARRRDFTMNSLAADPLTFEVFDPFGGVDDIESRVLKATDPKTFTEDPLRVYRGVQFVGRFNLEVDSETFRVMREMSKKHEFRNLPKDRVRGELDKLLLKSDKPSKGIELMKQLRILESRFPEIAELVGIKQEYEWHPEGNVYVHTLDVLDEAAKIVRREKLEGDLALMVLYGALAHDFGKPQTTRIEDGRIRSKGHEAAGVEPARKFAERIGLSENNPITLAMCAIAARHLQPGELYRRFEKTSDEKSYVNGIRTMIKSIKSVPYEVVLYASEADFRGRATKGVKEAIYKPGVKFRELVSEYNLDKVAQTNLILGRDILEEVNRRGLDFPVNDRWLFGKWIKEIETLRDEDPEFTKEKAWQMILRHLEDYYDKPR